MSRRKPEPFWREARACFYVQIGKRQIRLDPDKDVAWRLYHEMMAKPTDGRAESRGVLTGDGSPTLSELFDLFLGWCLTNRSPRTYESYRDMLQNLTSSVGDMMSIADLRPHHLTAVVEAKGPSWSNNTRNDFIAAVKRAVNWCVDEGRIERSPIERMKKPAREARETVATPADYELIMKVVRNPRLRDLIEMGWETGARPQEIVKIEARFYDRATARIVFPPSESKGKKHHRVIYLGADRAREIMDRLSSAHPTGVVFRNLNGDPWNKNSINDGFKRIRSFIAESILEGEGNPRPVAVGPPQSPKARERLARLAEWKREHALCLKERVPPIHFGALRKGYATESLKAGVDTIGLASLLGHRDTSMLSRVYAKVYQDPAYMADLAKKAGSRKKPVRNSDGDAST